MGILGGHLDRPAGVRPSRGSRPSVREAPSDGCKLRSSCPWQKEGPGAHSWSSGTHSAVRSRETCWQGVVDCPAREESRLLPDPGHLLLGWLASRMYHQVCQGLWTARGHRARKRLKTEHLKGECAGECASGSPWPLKPGRTVFPPPPHPRCLEVREQNL